MTLPSKSREPGPSSGPASDEQGAGSSSLPSKAILTNDVDAVFISDAIGRHLITLNGADRTYRLLVEDMADGAITLTPDGVVAWCNRSFAALQGRPLNRLIGSRVELCFAPEARHSLAALLADARDGKRSLEIDLLTESGLRIPTYLGVNPSVVDGLPEALCMVVTDLTEQRRSQADSLARQHLLAVIEEERRTRRKLEESLAALSLRDRALGAISQGVVITDVRGRITYTNVAFEMMSGYSSTEMQGRTCAVLQGPRTEPGIVRCMHESVADGRPFHGEVLNYRKDGELFWNDLSITPVLDGDGQPTQFVGVQRDVTKRKQADLAQHSLEAQLREAQKMEAIGTLAGGIAHDFNNILGSMLGNLALARHTAGVDREVCSLIDQASLAGKRARVLVEQILAFSRHQPTLLKAQPLEASVRDALKILRATLPPTVGLELVVDAKSRPMILGDATQLQQIVINLCTNAWQAFAGGAGRVVMNVATVHLESDADTNRSAGLPPGDYAHLSVIDNGPGMDVATQRRIFEPFFSTKASNQGTGLGLAVVHGIVASHHGHIAVRSRPGGGTVFDIYFPITHAKYERETVPAAFAEAAHGHGQRVLYIDDDEVMLLMVKHLLKRLGYRATCLSDPALAIAAVQKQPGEYDVVVTDYNMPSMSGLDVVVALRRINPELPVVISSGFVSDELRHAAEELDVFEVMRKENTLEDLAALLLRVFGGGATGLSRAPGPEPVLA